MSASLETIGQELSSKYSSERYAAVAVLDSVREAGVTYWVVQFSEAISGQRRQDLDVRIQHNGRTNVSGAR